jgi:hypothetical protein
MRPRNPSSSNLPRRHSSDIFRRNLTDNLPRNSSGTLHLAPSNAISAAFIRRQSLRSSHRRPTRFLTLPDSHEPVQNTDTPPKLARPGSPHSKHQALLPPEDQYTSIHSGDHRHPSLNPDGPALKATKNRKPTWLAPPPTETGTKTPKQAQPGSPHSKKLRLPPSDHQYTCSLFLSPEVPSSECSPSQFETATLHFPTHLAAPHPPQVPHRS